MRNARRFVFTVIALSTIAPLLQAAALSEGFDDVSTLPGDGWLQINNSAPLGDTDWFQGNTGIFPAQAGPEDSYIAANFVNAQDGGDISNWLILPELLLDNATQLSFYTRTEIESIFPDRLEVRLSTAGASTDVGTTASTVGDFSTLLLTVNPTLDPFGYPSEWTQFTVLLSSLPGPTSGRLAFRYFVPDTLEFGNYIGIDTVAVTPVPEPSCLALATCAMAWLLVSRRRRRPVKGSADFHSVISPTARSDRATTRSAPRA
ncbi:MAG: choice-of-anchor J domain-containing protein [Pirellulales bacterium]